MIAYWSTYTDLGGINMRVMTACLFLAAAGHPVHAQPGSSFVTSDGINRAPSTVLNCVGSSNMAVPCGTASQPLYVTSGSGLATAGNQANEITSQQAIASAAGAPGDASYTGGAGSMIALLKGVIGALSNGVTATPVLGTPVSRSGAVPASASTLLFPANAIRHYLALQAPPSTAIWVNFVGGAASPNGIDCVQLSAGTLYESGAFVTKGAVNIYSPVAVSVSAWEG
jgi:hypothetical protein